MMSYCNFSQACRRVRFWVRTKSNTASPCTVLPEKLQQGERCYQYLLHFSDPYCFQTKIEIMP